MLTKDQALERAIKYLAAELRRRLKISEGWLPVAPPAVNDDDDDEALERALAAMTPLELPPELAGRQAGVPAFGQGPPMVDIKCLRPEGPKPRAVSPPVVPSRRIWRVCVPSDHMHVGASRIITIDAENGNIVSDRHEGE